VERWVEKAGSGALLAPALAAEQNAAVGKGVILNPLDPAPAREKLLNGFLARRCSDVGRHDDLSSDRLLVRDAAHLSFRGRLKSEVINRRETRQVRIGLEDIAEDP
jgi:hypothetical protein